MVRRTIVRMSRFREVPTLVPMSYETLITRNFNGLYTHRLLAKQIGGSRGEYKKNARRHVERLNEERTGVTESLNSQRAQASLLYHSSRGIS